MTGRNGPGPDRRSAPKGESGFSLVDLLTGLAVSTVLIAGALTGVAQHQGQRRAHGELILVMSACRNKLEELRAVDIGDLRAKDGEGFNVPGQDGQVSGLNAIEGDADGLPGEIHVEEHARSVTGNLLYVVTVRVRWRGATRGGDFAMETLMGERR